ncbi:MAG TPA: hypothetical protein VG871_03345 [Vicinamibacterales bacterium]|nr:hypothetical protein [Vicinamibacterales bacterium]
MFEALATVVGLAVMAALAYLAWLAVVWSWAFLLLAAGAAIVGLVLLMIASGTPRMPSLASTIRIHAASSLAEAMFAVAAGLVLTALFQGVVLANANDLSVAQMSAFEGSILHLEDWLDTAIEARVLAGVLAGVLLLSLVIPAQALIERTISWRRKLALAYLVVATVAAFTFFGGRALHAYELRRRDEVRQEAAFAFRERELDDRKSLVAVAWLLQTLGPPLPPPIPPPVVQRLRGSLRRSPADDVERAAWRIAGYQGATEVSENDRQQEARHLAEVDILARDFRRRERPGAGDAPSGWNYAEVWFGLDAFRRGAGEWPVEAALKAAREVLSAALGDRIGMNLDEGLLRSFVSDLVEAVALPLWDVALPLDIRDARSAAAFVSAQGLDRAPLNWSETPTPPAEEVPPATPPDTTQEAPQPAGEGTLPQLRLGPRLTAPTPLRQPLFGRTPVFVTRLPGRPPVEYRGPVFVR